MNFEFYANENEGDVLKAKEDLADVDSEDVLRKVTDLLYEP